MFVQRASLKSPAVVRVRFSATPRLKNANNSDDALNPINYQISGGLGTLVVRVSGVASDANSVDVYCNTPLTPGVWTVFVSTAVVDSDGEALQQPNTATFGVASGGSTQSITGGAENDDPADVIRKHLPPNFKGDAWAGLIEAIASGDRANWENAQLAADQRTLSTASGVYLDRRAGVEGVSRPVLVGMSDEIFRKYAIKVKSHKIVDSIFWELVEVFYGTDAARAYVETELDSPFALTDGDTLGVTIDGVATAEVTFRSTEFESISAATAQEVAVIITRQMKAQNANALATSVFNPETNTFRVRIYSGSLGLASKVQVTGGMAQKALRFPDRLLGSTAAHAYAISKPETGVARYTWTSSLPDFHVVKIGDYATIRAPNFNLSNRGSFSITRVSSVWNGSDWVNSFDVANPDMVVEAGPLTLVDANEIEYWNPQTATIHKVEGRNAVISSTTARVVDVLLPATTQSVSRAPKSGAYLNATSSVIASAVEVRANGTALATTTTNHGLIANDHVMLDGLIPGVAVPANVANVDATPGNPGTTGASHMTYTSPVRSPDSQPGAQFSTATELSNGQIMIVGGQTAAATWTNLCSRFAISTSTTLGAGVAEGRKTYTYNYVATANAPVSAGKHTATALSGTLGGLLLLLGGETAADTPSSNAALYSPDTNAWNTALVGSLTARFYHQAVRLATASADDIVYILGGQTAATTNTTSIQKFTTAAGGTIAAALTDPVARCRHRAVAATSTTLVCAGGGKFVTGVLTPVAECFGIDSLTDAFFTVGNLAIARYDHAMVKLADNQVMVIGGIGRNLTKETANRTLSECEIWDRSTSSWKPAGKLRYARSGHQALAIGRKVYVFGGLGAASANIQDVEVYDIDTGRWTTAPSPSQFTGRSDLAASLVSAHGLIFNFGGKTSAGAYSSVANVIMPGAQSIASNGLNKTVKVVSVPSATTFTFAVNELEYAAVTSTTATALPAKAPSSFGPPGPFVWDPRSGSAVTGVEATLNQEIQKGRHYRSLVLSSADDFPDEEGWIAIAFGYENVVAPLKYLGRLSSTEIFIEYSHEFTANIASGAKVTLLAQKGPFAPEFPEEVGAFYATASSAGRVAAQQAIESVAAGGIDLNIQISYPGDRGLGGEGLGVTGQKLSDKVAIWGGDDLDEELEAAREDV